MSSKTTDNADEICPVCSEGMKIFAVGRCDHPVCYKCSTRMRVLCQQMYCPICRADMEMVAFIKKLHPFHSLITHHYQKDRKHKLCFENENIKDAFNRLLQIRCIKCEDRKPERNFQQYKDHMRKEHQLFPCELCVKNLQIFYHERKFYNRKDLATHKRVGDPNDKSYKGHPLCKFCDERYFDNDDLVKHLRKDHYFCHFCDADGLMDYFDNYEFLRKHFAEQHFLCEEGDCRHIQFTNVFRTEIDLKAHTSTMHSKQLKKFQARQARTLDLEFNYAPRSRTRDGGVITGADYQEVDKNTRKDRERYPKHHGGRKHGSDKESCYARDAKIREKKVQRLATDEATPSQSSDEEMVVAFAQNPEEFPGLNGENPKQVDAISKTAIASEESNESMAMKFAMSSNISYKGGDLGADAFPTLGASHKIDVNDKNDFPAFGKAAPKKDIRKPDKNNKATSKFTPTAWSKSEKDIEEDFPVLLGSKAKQPPGLKPSANIKESTYQKPPISFQSHLKSTSDSLTSSGKSLPRPSSMKEIASLVSSQEDFPSLGNTKKAAQTTTAWGPKQDQPAVVKQPEEENNFIKFTVKKKKKKGNKDENVTDKPKETATKTKDYDLKKVEITDKSTNITSSLSNGTTEGKSEEPVKKQKKEKKKKSDTKESATISDTVVVNKQEENEFDLFSTFNPPKSEAVKSRTKNTDLMSVRPSKTETEEETKAMKSFPSVHESENLFTEDFPSLSSSKKSSGPPPGFLKTAGVSKPPPGFGGHNEITPGNQTWTSRPPPGFSATPLSEMAVNTTLTGSSHDGSSNNSFSFIQPRDFNSHNHKLITDIQDALKQNGGNFDTFKSLSGKFRKNEIAAKEYYDECETLLGKFEFEKIFIELLVLLPDIDKQQELIEVHEKRKKSDMISKKGWRKSAWESKGPKFYRCTLCSQVIGKRDIEHHNSEHHLDSEFPCL